MRNIFISSIEVLSAQVECASSITVEKLKSEDNSIFSLLGFNLVDVLDILLFLIFLSIITMISFSLRKLRKLSTKSYINDFYLAAVFLLLLLITPVLITVVLYLIPSLFDEYEMFINLSQSAVYYFFAIGFLFFLLIATLKLRGFMKNL